MNIEMFAEWVQRKNKTGQNKVILAFIAFLGFDFLTALLSGNNSLLFLLAGQCIVVVTAMEVGRYQWNRYLYLNDKPISEITRLHAFPVKEYFSYVNKKMAVPTVLLGIFSVLFGIFAGISGEEKIFEWKSFLIMSGFGVICAICPFLVGIWKKKFFMYQSKMGTGGKLNIAHRIGTALFLVVEALFLVCVTVVSVIFLWGLLFAVLQPPIEETSVVFRTYEYGNSFIFILLAVLGGLWILITSGYHIKKLKRTVIVIAAVFFAAAVVMGIAEMHIYTEFAENQIIVRRLWDTKIYEMEDIESFQIYDENDSIQMKLYFNDSQSVKMIGAAQEYNDLYDQTYYSEYNYLADYVEGLLEMEISGRIEDVEKLRENVKGLDTQLGQGLEKIINLLQET